MSRDSGVHTDVSVLEEDHKMVSPSPRVVSSPEDGRESRDSGVQTDVMVMEERGTQMEDGQEDLLNLDNKVCQVFAQLCTLILAIFRLRRL